MLSIQPRWLIEEKAINFRRDVWFKPPKAPIKIEKKIIKEKKYKWIQKVNKIKGAIFCQVIKIKLFIQFKPSITLGNQKWKGAIPLFIIKEEAKIKLIKLNFKSESFHSIKKYKEIIENNRVLEAKAWVKKYFKEASEVNKLLDFIERGIKDKRLISSPIQILNQEVEDTLIIVLKIKVKEKSNL